MLLFAVCFLTKVEKCFGEITEGNNEVNSSLVVEPENNPSVEFVGGEGERNPQEYLESFFDTKTVPVGIIRLPEEPDSTVDPDDISSIKPSVNAAPESSRGPSESLGFEVSETVPALSSKKLGLCEGDCDSDEDCEVGLYCFIKDSDTTSVPGCSGFDASRTDYCTKKTETSPTFPKPLPMLFVFEANPPDISNLPLKRCQGDCDRDSDCAEGLICYERPPHQTRIPGCSGISTTRTDFCVDLNWRNAPSDDRAVDPTLSPIPNPTFSPTVSTSTVTTASTSTETTASTSTVTTVSTSTETTASTVTNSDAEEIMTPRTPVQQRTLIPSKAPTFPPTKPRTNSPTKAPTFVGPPTKTPTLPPTRSQTHPPTKVPTFFPTKPITNPPTKNPTLFPTKPRTNSPTRALTQKGTPPTIAPTRQQTAPVGKASGQNPNAKDLGADSVNVTFAIYFDPWPQELSWKIETRNPVGGLIASVPAGTYQSPKDHALEALSLTPGENYVLTIEDSGNDGIAGIGTLYEIFLTDHPEIVLLDGDGVFEESRTATFYVPTLEEYPPIAPATNMVVPSPTVPTVKVYLVIAFDSWHQETAWTIADESDPKKIYAEATYDTYRAGETITEEIVLPATGGIYVFTIRDFFNDGIIDGEYLLMTADGVVVLKGDGDFGSFRSHAFKLPAWDQTTTAATNANPVFANHKRHPEN